MFCSKTTLSSAFATVVVVSTFASEPAATVDSLRAAESSAEPCSLNEAEWDTDTLVEVEALADAEALADSVVDSVVDSDWDSVVEVVPSTVLPCSTRASLESSDAVATSDPVSSAFAVFATVAAPRTAPAATIPLSKPRLVISFTDTASSRTSATTVSSTWPRMTFKRPKLEVAARNQFLPDLINLKRVTRSVSRNSPFERLKNISVSLLHFLFP